MTCTMCNGSRLQFGGWMGPTTEAPFPRPCRCSPDLTAREIQVLQTEWFLDNQDDPRVQQILARAAVLNAATYGTVVLAPSRGRERRIDHDLLARADLVVGAGNRVVKDRWGTAGYKLSPTELRRIMDDCDTVVCVAYDGSTSAVI